MGRLLHVEHVCTLPNTETLLTKSVMILRAFLLFCWYNKVPFAILPDIPSFYYSESERVLD